MITTVCLNPCVDRTVFVNQFLPGELNKVDHCRCDVAGKGFNVNQVLQHLGVPAQCLCLDYTGSGDAIKKVMAERNIPYTAVKVPGELRMNIKLMDMISGEMTEINEQGTLVEADTQEKVMQLLNRLIPQTDILVLNGSVPPGFTSDIYRQMIEVANAAGVKTILDASGKMLAEGIKAKPWAIKPNTYELELLCGRKIQGSADAIAVCKQIVAEGIHSVCLSMGAEGAWMIEKDGVWYSAGIDIQVKSRHGAGDSLVAGLCAALQQNGGPEEQLRMAVAAAHGSLLLEGTQLCTKEDFDQMLPLIAVMKTE